MPTEAWAACAAPDVDVPPGTPVALGFDGSTGGIGRGHDSTAIVGCTIDDEVPHLFVVGCWQSNGEPEWTVPRGEVTAALADAMDRWDVREVACDPYGYRAEMETWQARWPGRIVEWPTNRYTRFAPAVDRLYQAVKQQAVTHDDDERLSAHVTNAVVKTVPNGEVITKPDKHSPHKIDLAVAACLAPDRATWHAHNQSKALEGVWFL